MSSHSHHTEWILETIDHLRKRKARPDLHRICHVVRRRFGLPIDATEVRLEKLVDAEIVIKVDYKGSTSYRNASKWRKSMIGCHVQNSSTVSTKIIEAILILSKSNNVSIKTDKSTCDGEHSVSSNEDSNSNGNSNEVNSNSSSKDIGRDHGVDIEEIEKWMSENCEGFENLKSPLNIVLKREVEAGRIERLDKNGRFVISSAQKDELKNDDIKLLDTNCKKSETKSNVSPQKKEGEGGESKLQGQQSAFKTDACRVLEGKLENNTLATHQPSRRGRPPKFRPPDNSTSFVPLAHQAGNSGKISKLKRSGSQTAADEENKNKTSAKCAKKNTIHPQTGHCQVCKRTDQCNVKGQEELLLNCKDCSVKAHPSGLSYNPILASRAAKSLWQCVNCKTCCVCNDSGHGYLMLFCDGCDKGYHMTCHVPPVHKKPSGLWECYSCRLENSNLERSEFAATHLLHRGSLRDSAPPTPAESPIPLSPPDIETDSDFPDASKWTVDEVVDYFTSAGFQDQAQVFKEQEIDGVALLLLKRGDVLRGLSLKLGPALKLNRLIQGFQTAKLSQNG